MVHAGKSSAQMLEEMQKALDLNQIPSEDSDKIMAELKAIVAMLERERQRKPITHH
jgi:hypothetical protein